MNTIEPADTLGSYFTPKDLPWGNAIHRWKAGDLGPLAIQVAALDLPDFAKQFLADLAAGKAKRRQGRKATRSEDEQHAIWEAVCAEWAGCKDVPGRDSSGPRDKAIATAADRLGMTHDAARGVFERYKPWPEPIFHEARLPIRRK